MKKLLITSTELMMIQFLVPHVKYLAANGFQVEIACSHVGGRMDDVRAALEGVAVIHEVRLERSPLSPQNLLGYGDMKRLLQANHYDIIWTNEPVMGVVTRLAANKYRRKGTKVVYMCHGFHFYKGAGKANWLLYCPVETVMAACTDVLVTINWEDYNWANNHLRIPGLEHIDGIGVDFSRLRCTASREEKRRELGIGENETMILSVGELQTRKNHEVIIRALARLENPNVCYLICGRGILLDQLKQLAKDLGVENQVGFLGYRRDISEIMGAADIYAHPSRREGLGLASLEAMAMGLPLVTSNVQGIPDYVENGVTGYMCDPMDIEKFAEHLRLLIADVPLRREMSRTNRERVKKYSMETAMPAVCRIMCSAAEKNGSM